MAAIAESREYYLHMVFARHANVGHTAAVKKSLKFNSVAVIYILLHPCILGNSHGITVIFMGKYHSLVLILFTSHGNNCIISDLIG